MKNSTKENSLISSTLAGKAWFGGNQGKDEQRSVDLLPTLETLWNLVE